MAYRIPNLPFFYLVFRWWSHWRGDGHPHIKLVDADEYSAKWLKTYRIPSS